MTAFFVLTVVATIIGGLVGGLSGGMYRLKSGGGIFIKGRVFGEAAAVLSTIILGFLFSVSVVPCVLAAIASYFLSLPLGRFINTSKLGL